MTNIIQFILSLLIIVCVSLIIRAFYNRTNLKDPLKKLIVGIIYGLLSIGCSFLSLRTESLNTIALSNSAVILGGVVFGGPVGLIAGVMSAIERFFSIYYGSLVATRYAVPLSLLFAGAISFLFYKLVNENKEFKWHFLIVASIIVESFELLILFLPNLKDLTVAYNIASDTIFYSFLFNIISILISLVPIIILNKNKFKNSKPYSIQSKMQVRLAIAIVFSFLIVIVSINGVLRNISNEQTKSSIAQSVSDIKDNIASDIKTDIKSAYSKVNQAMKTSTVMVNPTKENIRQIAALTGFSNISIFSKDGSIVGSSDPYVLGLSNASEFESVRFPGGIGTVIITDYTYIPEKQGYFQYYMQLYSPNKDEEYVIVEVNEERYNELILNSINKGIAKRHLGENGLVIVLNKNNEIISSPLEDENQTLNYDFSKIGTLGTTEFLGETYYVCGSEFCDYKIIGLMEKTSTDINKNISIYIASFSTILVFFLLYFVIYYSIKSQVLKPLLNVNESLDKIAKGHLDEKVNETDSRELKSLSEDINITVESLKEYMGREAKMIQKDLNFAKDIQLSALPTNFPKHDKFDIYATMDTAKEVGGDFYDFYFIDDNHLCILIADVSGKGVPAALFMMQSKTIIKSYIEAHMPLEDAFNLANKKLCEVNKAGMFVTVWCGILDLETGKLEYINAGHNQPLIKNDDEYKFLECKPGFVFGVMDIMKYHLQTVELKKGAELYLYTDGINEATSVNEELYGNDRMILSANTNKYENSKEFLDKMIGSVKEFTKDAEQSDDITQLHIRYFG